MKKKNIVISILIVSTLVFSGLNFSVAKNISFSSEISANSGRTYRAVMAAVGDYNGDGDYNDNGDLKNTVSDLVGVKNVLDDSYDEIKILTDTDATSSKLNSWLNWLINNAGSNDVSLIYYSGHGGQTSDGKDEYLYLYDGEYLDHDFASKISKIPGYVIVILDSCHNHGFVDDVDEIQDNWVSEDIVMFTCHDEKQSNWGWNLLGHSFFSFAIISALVTDTENNNAVTIGEFYDVLDGDYEFIRHEVGINYKFGANLYYKDYNVKNIEIISHCSNNDRPDIDKLDEDINKGKIDLELKVKDQNGDNIDLFIYWGDGQGGWDNDNPYHPGDIITKDHTYSRSGTYNIMLIGRDEHGSTTYYILSNRQITNKHKLFSNSYLSNFPLFQHLIQKLNI